MKLYHQDFSNISKMKRFTIYLLITLTASISLFSQEYNEEDPSKRIPDHTGEYKVTNLEINSYDSDFGVTYYEEGKILFTSTRKDSDNSAKRWKGNNQRFLNFYVGETDDQGNVISYESLKGEGNTKFHESNATFNKDHTKVYFTRNTLYGTKKGLSKDRKMKLSIYIADVDSEGKWHNIVPFPYNSDEYSNGHPTLSLDGKIMYFTSDMPGTIGKTDIFKVEITETGTFTVPKNLGGNVNTPGREMFPFIAADGTLYFSSDYHKGKGKLDIFKTDSDELELAAIQNIGEPFNSSRDDFAFVLNNNLLEGYFSSNRTGGRGDDDIYYFVNKNKSKIIKKREPLPEVPCTNLITGVITDKKDEALLSNALVEIFDQEGNTVYKVKVGPDGHFEYETPCEKTYIVKASKPLYLEKEITVYTTDVLGQEVTANISLVPEIIKVNGKIVIDIESIYFDFDDYRITPQAAIELDKVIAFMNKYPKVIIEGGSHTDSRGRADYNMKLSEKRARSTVNYIMKNGHFDATRISAHGYGETQLVNNCSDGVRCSDEEHARNRRTEFVIINAETMEE
jgi:outer membrane protein OmpA-like peptidoglycan-associated protein